MHVWGSDDGAKTWRAVFRFENVRHIHGVYLDRFEDSIWITTGDDDAEAGIWRTTNGFKTVEKIVGGSQQLRVVRLLFTEDSVYFGSDAPSETNHIYRLDRTTRKLTQLLGVEGPIFHGCTTGDRLFFSTVCEPSRINASREAVLWASRDGFEWERLLAFHKDLLPLRLFQYGQILFPNGPGIKGKIWITPFATESDQQSICLPV